MSSCLPNAAWLVALLTLPGVGPARLRRMLDRWPPEAAWHAVVKGDRGLDAIAQQVGLAAKWTAHGAGIDTAVLWQQYREAGVGVFDRRSPGFPAELVDDPEPPEVLFVDGDLARLGPLTVGIVGTRKCTRYGIDLAYELGALLADKGVNVVSGLALGIDAAAHAGALDANGAAPVGVVATGLDRPYPRQNASLWARVAAMGMLVSEAPLGTTAERWRFPARNRIIAGLSKVVVVVESHDRGGSLYTANQAIERDRQVLAVPGPIRSSASSGTNRLLADGCHPVCEPEDVLAAVGLVAPTAPPVPEVPVTRNQAAVLDALGWQPATLSELAGQSGLGLEELALAVEELRSIAMIASRGPWLERTQLRYCRATGPNDLIEGDQAAQRPRGAT